MNIVKIMDERLSQSTLEMIAFFTLFGLCLSIIFVLFFFAEISGIGKVDKDGYWILFILGAWCLFSWFILIQALALDKKKQLQI